MEGELAGYATGQCCSAPATMPYQKSDGANRKGRQAGRFRHCGGRKACQVGIELGENVAVSALLEEK